MDNAPCILLTRESIYVSNLNFDVNRKRTIKKKLMGGLKYKRI